MKKIVAVLLLITMILSLTLFTGCGGKADQKDKTPVTFQEELVVDVMSKNYGAKGDGVTSDRAVIQQAIDDVHNAGGGTVLLTAGHTFLSGNLLLKSNVTLKFGDGAVLQQNSDPEDYIEVRGFDYGDGFVEIGEPYKPFVGMQLIPYGDGSIWPESVGKWRECWYWNYPLIYAEQSENVKIMGNGTIQSMPYSHATSSSMIYMLLIGFYRVNNFVVSGLKLNHESSHCYNFNNCNNGLIVDVENWTPAATAENMASVASICDGLKLVNCQNIMVADCLFAGGDDSCLIISSYNDNRYDRWASSKDIQPTKNIEISNCIFPSYYKGLGFCALGMMCEDRSLVEISDIYIHDSKFCSVGMWEGFGWMNRPDDTLPNYGHYNPIKNLRWENNDYEYWTSNFNHAASAEGLQIGMQDYPVSDQISDDPRLHSMTEMRNTSFEDGISYWIDKTENGSVAEVRTDSGGADMYGYLGGLDKGNARLYEGIYLEKGSYQLKAKIKTQGGAKDVLEVTDQSDAPVAVVETTAGEWTEVPLNFTIACAGNYRLGVLGSISGSVMIDDFELKKLA